ncbi:hypothetical protein WJX77_002646 [Trebouxia sp. C0004]
MDCWSNRNESSKPNLLPFVASVGSSEYLPQDKARPFMLLRRFCGRTTARSRQHRVLSASFSKADEKIKWTPQAGEKDNKQDDLDNVLFDYPLGWWDQHWLSVTLRAEIYGT